MKRRDVVTYRASSCCGGGNDRLLLDNRRMHDFVGSRLPSTHPDDPLAEPIRYEVADDWIDLLVLHDPAWGYEVHVRDRSAEEIGLGDVYSDLRDQLLTEAGVQIVRPVQPDLVPALRELIARLDRLTQYSLSGRFARRATSTRSPPRR